MHYLNINSNEALSMHSDDALTSKRTSVPKKIGNMLQLYIPNCKYTCCMYVQFF